MNDRVAGMMTLRGPCNCSVYLRCPRRLSWPRTRARSCDCVLSHPPAPQLCPPACSPTLAAAPVPVIVPVTAPGATRPRVAGEYSSITAAQPTRPRVAGRSPEPPLGKFHRPTPTEIFRRHQNAATALARPLRFVSKVSAHRRGLTHPSTRCRQILEATQSEIGIGRRLPPISGAIRMAQLH